MLACIAILLADAATGSWLARAGKWTIMAALLIGPGAAVVMLRRWLHIRTSAVLSEGPDRLILRAGYRSLSMFILIPAMVFVLIHVAGPTASRRYFRQLRPIHEAMLRRQDDAAADLLMVRLRSPRWTPPEAAMASLLALRGGDAKAARAWAEASVRKRAIFWNRGCGDQLGTVDRSSCAVYAGQVRTLNTLLDREFAREFCRAFPNRFPEPPRPPELAPLTLGESRSGCYPPVPPELGTR
jgi:hypothetical protein